jgi:hypothetical protein
VHPDPDNDAVRVFLLADLCATELRTHVPTRKHSVVPVSPNHAAGDDAEVVFAILRQDVSFVVGSLSRCAGNVFR